MQRASLWLSLTVLAALGQALGPSVAEAQTVNQRPATELYRLRRICGPDADGIEAQTRQVFKRVQDALELAEEFRQIGDVEGARDV